MSAAQRSQFLSQVLGQPFRHRAVPAHVARRDGAARLGQLRHHHRHRRRVRRSPELRHGRHRPRARGAGFSRRHHRAAGLAERRAVQAVGRPNLFFGISAGNMDSMVNRYTSDKQDPQRRRVHAGRPGRQTAGPLLVVYAQRAARRSRMCRSSSAASRRRCAASRTTTTGARRCDGRCCSMPRPTCWCTAMPSGRSSRSRIASRPARRSRRSPTCAAPRSCARRTTASRSTRLKSIRPGALNPPIDPYAMEPEIREANEQAAAVEAGEAAPVKEVVVKFARTREERGRERSVIRMPSFEQVKQRSGPVRARLAHPASRDQPRQRARAGAGAWRSRPVAESAADSAHHQGDGLRVRAAVRARAASASTATPRSPPTR